MTDYCPSIFPKTFQERIVKVAWMPNTFTGLSLSWPVQPNASGGYNVYGSPSPLQHNKLNAAPIMTTTFDYNQIPHAPEDTVWHFWVTWIDPFNVETLIEQDPATLSTNIDPFSSANNPQSTAFGQNMIPNDMMSFYFDEIRRRHQALIENDGEDFTLFYRRWSGKPCPKHDARTSSDPDYDSAARDTMCFGTGILGGYYPALHLKMRYGEAPPRKIMFTPRGLEVGHDFNSWTLWLPKIHEHDLVIRNKTGERFIVENAAETNWRGLPLSQRFRLLSLQPGDIRSFVDDAAISAAFTHENDPYERPGIWG